MNHVRLLAVLMPLAASAQSFPSSPQLVYRGVVTSGALAPSPEMKVRLWKSATSSQSSDIVCEPPVFVPVTVDASGRFEVQLDTTCIDVIRNGGDVFAELDIRNVGAIRPRSALKAVPYALKAATANRVILVSAGGARTSADGLVCGTTTATNGNWAASGASGYRAGKLLCEARCASTTAHVCTSNEVVRQLGLGDPIPDGWVVTGKYAHVPGTPVFDNADCAGFKSAGAQVAGGVFENGVPLAVTCDQTRSIICCD